MGFAASKLWSFIVGAKEEYKIVIIGLSNAGKTTILYRMHLGQVITTRPTIGSNVEEVQHQNLRMQVWDLGGQENILGTWSNYFSKSQVIIFVVDSTDQDNIMVAKMELYNVLLDESLVGASLLVWANKQDLPTARNPGEISEALKLHSIKTHDWHIQGCSALTGDGIKEGLDWIVHRLRMKSGRS